ncbi:hypothetical protein QLX08_007222 [Tetragonisca angustula]|uniref:Reverse transcriptase domain-containing protein n=1 Tax=Tetragonisca angustula TaxID=166442 RepID=A0AAW0ZQF6_9HYME
MHSKFPHAWKTAKIHSIPKPGKPNTIIQSYRPISVFSTNSKILEKIILSHLHTHLRNNNIIIPQQYGFRENHSCIHQLFRVTEFAMIELNKNRTTQLILLDMEKSFDTVWHEALIHKLQKINIVIKSYLTDRKMFVIIKGTNSTTHNVIIGVPQGSILGSTLFNIYINDIPTTNNTQLAIYDDTTIYASFWNPRQATKYLQEYIDMISEHMHKWKLRINPQKTQAITFTRKNLQIITEIKINGFNVPKRLTT